MEGLVSHCYERLLKLQVVDGKRRRPIGMMMGKECSQRLVSPIWDTLISWLFNVELWVSVCLSPLFSPLFIGEVSLKFMQSHAKRDCCA